MVLQNGDRLAGNDDRIGPSFDPKLNSSKHAWVNAGFRIRKIELDSHGSKNGIEGAGGPGDGGLDATPRERVELHTCLCAGLSKADFRLRHVHQDADLGDVDDRDDLALLKEGTRIC